MVRCQLLDEVAYRAREDERRAAVSAYQLKHGSEWTDELLALNASFFPPGTMWFCSWYHDPQAPGAGTCREKAILDIAAGKNLHLSIHYWQDWSLIRPPICVVCPSGLHWVIDAKSSNGDGWTVTGSAPDLVVTPSIWVGQGKGPPREYHGWLGSGGAAPGHFSAPL